MNQATPDPARIARDLTASQKRILLYMHPQDTASFVDIATLLGLSRPRKTLASLRNRGLVERDDLNDPYYVLTEDGVAVRSEVERMRDEQR